jgi:hypothetical protein
MNDALIALIRTVVPTLVGALTAWLASVGLQLDAETSAALIVALTGLFSGLYYTVIRFLAERFPWVNWLLGYNATPSYSETEPVG